MLRLLFVVVLLLLVPVGSVHADATAPWSPGRDAAGDDTFAGAIDAPSPGATLSAMAPIDVHGWVVDQTAEGWAGIDQVQVFLGAMDGGGQLLASANVAQNRPDVGVALGNPFFGASGYAASLPAGSVPLGQSTLNVYIHSPGKGWWFQSLSVQVQNSPVAVAAPPRPTAVDDVVLVVEAPLPDIMIVPTTQTLTVRGFALDRNALSGTGPGTGVGGSGISQIQVYLDGNRRDGTFIGQATLGEKSREATGFGDRFEMSGWEMQIHPNELVEDPHALFVYATAASNGNDTLVVVPFRIASR